MTANFYFITRVAAVGDGHIPIIAVQHFFVPKADTIVSLVYFPANFNPDFSNAVGIKQFVC